MTSLYAILAVILFTIGLIGVLIRRNALIMFMCVELMLNAANLLFVAFSAHYGILEGQMAAFFVMVVAAAEVVIGLSIIVMINRARRTTSVDTQTALKG